MCCLSVILVYSLISYLQAGQAGLDTVRKLSQAGLNKAATTVVYSAMKVRTVMYSVCLYSSKVMP